MEIVTNKDNYHLSHAAGIISSTDRGKKNEWALKFLSLLPVSQKTSHALDYTALLVL
jgi:hypothetical protein